MPLFVTRARASRGWARASAKVTREDAGSDCGSDVRFARVRWKGRAILGGSHQRDADATMRREEVGRDGGGGEEGRGTLSAK